MSVIDLTPESPDEGHQRWGKDVTTASFAIIRREAPMAVAKAVESEQAFIINIFGKDDLVRIDACLEKYGNGGNSLVWHHHWQHPGAGRIETYVFLCAPGKTPQQVMNEKLGWGNA